MNFINNENKTDDSCTKTFDLTRLGNIESGKISLNEKMIKELKSDELNSMINQIISLNTNPDKEVEEMYYNYTLHFKNKEKKVNILNLLEEFGSVFDQLFPMNPRKNKKEVSKDSEVPTFKKELYGMKYYCYQFFHKLPLLFAVGVLLCAPFSSAISPSFLGLLSFIFLICMFLNRQCFRIAHVSLSTNDTNAVSQSASFAAQSVNGIFNFFQGPASAAPTPWVVNVENCLLSDESIRGIFKRIG